MLNRKWENFFLCIIILSIVQLFLEEYSIIGNWLVSTRHLLIYIGFAFDAVFTLEFFIRLIVAGKKGEAGTYFKHQRGWIDLLASVPLLLLYSGPMVYTISKVVQVTVISQLVSFKTLKMLRIIRISRILRLLRILKIFGKLSKSGTKMIKHHIATIATTAIASLIIGLFLIRIIFNFLNWPGLEFFGNQRGKQYSKMIDKANILAGQFKINIQQSLNLLFMADKRVLMLSHDGQTIISKDEVKELLTQYGINDLMIVEKDSTTLWFDVSDINKHIAKNNLEIFTLVIFILGGILLLYSKHFIKYITLPLDAIQQKITDPSYSPQIMVNKAYKDDEVYEILDTLNKKDTSVGGY